MRSPRLSPVNALPDEPLTAADGRRAADHSIDGAWLATVQATSPDCLGAVERLGRQLGITPDEMRQTLAAVPAELARRLPSFFTGVTVVALLPVIVERSRRRFRRQGLSRHEAEDLSQTVATRILTAVAGSGPRRNAGAWAAAIRNNVLNDYFRGVDRVRRKFGRRCDARRLDALAARPVPPAA